MPELSLEVLLAMYQRYKLVNEQVQRAGRELAQVKLHRSVTTELAASYNLLRDELQTLSDDMTFSCPTVWMRYKFEAYAGEAQPIRTMHDFRLHCSKPGYICTKRFHFVNAALLARGAATLDDPSKFPDDILLVDACEAIRILEADPECMAAWQQHEYYRDNGRVAKWETYSEV
ncbi:MAG TPA: hypothetical protein PKD68_05320 [Candidatus Saccharibacteria bacterium]|nr:hypothetical protein [Candidatus Saccharibacteria bacterium]